MASSPLANLKPRLVPVAEAVAAGAALTGKLLVSFGWPEKSAMVRASELKKNEQFTEAVRYLLDRRLFGLVPLALSTIEAEMRSGGKERVKAALAALDRSGYGAARSLDVNISGSIEHLSVEEIDRQLAEIERRARSVDGGELTALPPPIDADFTELQNAQFDLSAEQQAEVARQLAELGIRSEDLLDDANGQGAAEETPAYDDGEDDDR